jgi:CRP-like cAMP-binding protein
MSSLFNITQERKYLIQMLESANGEATDELVEALAINRDDFLEKSEGYGIIMRKLETDEIAIDSEISRLTALKKAKANAYARLEQTLLEALQLYGQQDAKGIWRAEAGTFRFSTARSPKSVDVFDEALIPDEFKVEKITVSVSKTTIKNALDLGQDVPGAAFKEGSVRLVLK